MNADVISANRLLSLLPRPIAEKLAPAMRVVAMEHGQVLVRENDKVELVYFPHSGVISSLVSLAGSGPVEASSIGVDGTFGAGQALDHRISINDAVVTSAGYASVIEPAELERLAVEATDLRKMLLSYDQFVLAHVQQNAVCNAAHSAKQRYAKQLLRLRDLAGNKLLLPQHVAAQHIGVRRTTVTIIANELAHAGAIRFARGRINILSPNVLERAACESHHRIASFYEKLVVRPN